MPRLLLFLLVGVIAFVSFQRCSASAELGPAVYVERDIVAPDESTLLAVESKDGATRLLLTHEGAIAQIVLGGTPLLRPVPGHRRPLTLHQRDAVGGTRSLASRTWSNEPADRGRTFTLAENGTTLKKSVRLADDGRAVLVSLEVRGAPDALAGFEMTGPSGLLLGDRLDRSGVVLKRAPGGPPQFESYEAIAGRQETRRRQEKEKREQGQPAAEAPYPTKFEVGGGGRLPLAGIVGRDAYLAFSDLQGVDALSVEAYRAVRDGEEQPDLETWATLTTTKGALDAAFRLEFGDLERLRAGEPELFLAPEFRRTDEKTHVLENDTLRLVLSDRGAIVAAYLKRFTQDAGQEPKEATWIPILRPETPVAARALTLDVREVERLGADPARDPWEVEASKDRVVFRLRTPKGWTIEKVVALPDEGRYDLRVEVAVTAPAGERALTYRLIGPSGVYIEDIHRGITPEEAARILRLERADGEGDDATLEEIKERAERMDRRYGEARDRGLFRAFAIRGAYFVGTLATWEPTEGSTSPRDVVAANVEAVALTRAVLCPDGETWTRDSMLGRITCEMDVSTHAPRDHYTLYVGPNADEYLRAGSIRHLGLDDTVDFGMFAFIGRFLMWLMKLFEGLIGSYGVAVMLMTMVVRALLAPVSYRTQLSMQRYSKRVGKIKPLLDDLQKRYAQNPQKMNQERLRVMREHKIGFPAGCLTIFLQIPIWFALFQGLRVEFSLRHEPFLWAEDLAMPDRLARMPGFLANLPIWPDWFNLLPLLMLLLWVWQQKVTPTPASDDPQVRAQMRMMRFMPYMFLVFLYNYAAALSVYMCVSSIWGIVEGKLVRRALQRVG